MVVVYRAFDHRLVSYTADHEPAHVHVTGPGQAKINLIGSDGRPELVYSIGIGRQDMRRLMAEVDRNRDAFLEAWRVSMAELSDLELDRAAAKVNGAKGGRPRKAAGA